MKRWLGIVALLIWISSMFSSCSTCGHCENTKGQWITYKYCKHRDKQKYQEMLDYCNDQKGIWVSIPDE